MKSARYFTSRSGPDILEHDMITTNPLRAGLSLQQEPPPFTIVIFGATGDLTAKKLVPALFSLFIKGTIADFNVIGFARRPWSDESFRERMAEAIAPLPFHAEANVRRSFLQKFTYLQSNFQDRDGYLKLATRIGTKRLAVFYLSTPPTAYETIIENLGTAGGDLSQTRIIVEKPFGYDLASARSLNDRLLAHFTESQIFRIDHYLGKETVQNMMVLRFGNSIFEPMWNNRYIHHVQITVAETLGIEGRGHYYEKAGAVRDILQNHLLQLLCLAAMEPPIDLTANSIRNEKVKVLSGLKLIKGADVKGNIVRGQYTEGFVGGESVIGYREENDVAPDSRVETYIALRVFIDTWRWAGVPFFLRTGKRLSRRLTEISVQFQKPPVSLFGGWMSAPKPNILTWRIQPDEGMRFVFNSKIPGFKPLLSPVHMRFAYGSAFGEESPDAYERLLVDVLHGDSTLFTRNDEIEAAWNFTTELAASVADYAADDLSLYRAGTGGPARAQELLGPHHATWRRL